VRARLDVNSPHQVIAPEQRRRLIVHAHFPMRIIFVIQQEYGGDGLAAARHLERFGFHPSVLLLSSLAQLKAEPAVFAGILANLDVPILELTSDQQLPAARERIASAAAIVDALLGIGLRGMVRPLCASVISLLNQAGKPIVSADVPSGLDADSGQPLGIAVKATVTVSFGLAKQGCFKGRGPAHVGQLIVDPITMPPRLLAV
jgi:NAD(P)H-hydrate epimerase